MKIEDFDLGSISVRHSGQGARTDGHYPRLCASACQIGHREFPFPAGVSFGSHPLCADAETALTGSAFNDTLVGTDLGYTLTANLENGTISAMLPDIGSAQCLRSHGLRRENGERFRACRDRMWLQAPIDVARGPHSG